mgnify:CR=1 FL=1
MPSAQRLPLRDQLRYTAGRCGVFAATLEDLGVGRRVRLVTADTAYLERLYGETVIAPVDQPEDVHEAVQLGDGGFVDATGRATLDQIAVSFGVGAGRLTTALPERRLAPCPALREFLRHLGWDRLQRIPPFREPFPTSDDFAFARAALLLQDGHTDESILETLRDGALRETPYRAQSVLDRALADPEHDRPLDPVNGDPT